MSNHSFITNFIYGDDLGHQKKFQYPNAEAVSKSNSTMSEKNAGDDNEDLHISLKSLASKKNFEKETLRVNTVVSSDFFHSFCSGVGRIVDMLHI